MNCESCEIFLIDHVHGELVGAESANVAAHLADCSSCALAFCRLRADVDGIATTYARVPTSTTAARLRARVEAEFRPSWWQRALTFANRPVPAYGIACAAVLPLVVWAASAGFESASPTEIRGATEDARPAVIRDYDATQPLADPRIL